MNFVCNGEETGRKFETDLKVNLNSVNLELIKEAFRLKLFMVGYLLVYRKLILFRLKPFKAARLD